MNVIDKVMKILGYEKEDVAKDLRKSNKELQKRNQLLIATVSNLQEDIISLRHGLSFSSKELEKKERKLLSNEKSLEMAKKFEENKKDFFGGK